MNNLLRKIYYAINNFIKRIVRFKGRIGHIATECKEDKLVFNKRKNEWKNLNKAELRKYRREKYTYLLFKNLAPDFDEYSDYYVTDNKYLNEIMPRLSDESHSAEGVPVDTIFNNKNYFECLFPQITFPTAIVRRIDGNYFDMEYNLITREEALLKLEKYSDVVFKKTLDTQHGNGIQPASGEQIAKVFKSFGENFVVQELIKQHEFLASFNSSSVNVIRVITVFWKGHSYVLDSRLRVGAPGSFCDHLGHNGKNPIEIGISEDGSLRGKAFDDTDGVYLSDIFGKEAVGIIPEYRQMLDIALKGQLLYPTYGLLGWDFTVSEDGSPICIEVNSKYPAIKAAQCVNGPIFMKKTVDGNPLLDEIMSEPINLGRLKMI